jgi:hypothetical protein
MKVVIFTQQLLFFALLPDEIERASACPGKCLPELDPGWAPGDVRQMHRSPQNAGAVWAAVRNAQRGASNVVLEIRVEQSYPALAQGAADNQKGKGRSRGAQIQTQGRGPDKSDIAAAFRRFAGIVRRSGCPPHSALRLTESGKNPFGFNKLSDFEVRTAPGQAAPRKNARN